MRVGVNGAVAVYAMSPEKASQPIRDIFVNSMFVQKLIFFKRYLKSIQVSVKHYKLLLYVCNLSSE